MKFLLDFIRALTSVGQERIEADQSQPPPVNSSANAVDTVQWNKRSDGAAGPTVTETGKTFHDEVETYLDERGRLRVSRLRALGIRMTRDLQRNLDLMKEIDQEKADANQKKNNESATARSPLDVLDNSSGGIQHREVTDKNNDGMNNEVDRTAEPAVVNGASIEISFEDTSEHDEHGNNDDKLFARLVAGDPVMDFSVDNSAIAKQLPHSASDNEWEEGVIEGKSTEHLYEGGMSDEGEVEWEEGFQDIQLTSLSCPDESQKTVTKGALEEEAAFQEAIRRSLEDTRGHRSMDGFHGNQTSERAREIVSENTDCVSVSEGKEGPDVETLANNVSQPFGSMNDLDTNCSEAKSATFIELSPDKSNLDPKLLNQDAGESGALAGEMLVASDALPGGKGLSMTGKQPLGTCIEDGNGHAMNKLVGASCVKIGHNSGSSALSSSFTDSLHDNLLDCGSAPAQHMFQAELDDHFCDTEKLGNISADDSVTDVDGTKELAKEKIDGNFSMEKDEVKRNDNKEHEITEDHLEEEMLFLGKEREEIGSEQRKLERDAESVSSEMFAECQVCFRSYCPSTCTMIRNFRVLQFG